MDGQGALRPPSEDDLAMLEELTQDPEQAGEFDWFGWFDRRRWRRGWDENGLLGPDGGTLIVVSGSARLGPGNWREASAHPGRELLGDRHRAAAPGPWPRVRHPGAAAARPLSVRTHHGAPYLGRERR